MNRTYISLHKIRGFVEEINHHESVCSIKRRLFSKYKHNDILACTSDSIIRHIDYLDFMYKPPMSHQTRCVFHDQIVQLASKDPQLINVLLCIAKAKNSLRF